MIKNERQYRMTKAQVEKFERALADVQAQPDDPAVHPILRKAGEDALRSQLEDFRRELIEYEALKSGDRPVLELRSFEDLPRTLIRARITQGLSQKDLADKLGLKEQQIQRYEATEYATASLARLQEVIRTLNLEVQEGVFLPTTQLTSAQMFERLKDAGIEREFVLSRLLPRNLAENLRDEDEFNEGVAVYQAATRVGRVFGWTPAEIMGSSPLMFNPEIGGSARFKMPLRVDEHRVSAYTIYSHYLASLVLQATEHLPQRPLSTDPRSVREEILSKYGSLTFRTVLSYVWDQGVPVLPLNDPGVFHGACWRVDGRNIIILKQRSRSAARWLFDLLHEFRHAGEEPAQAARSVIELPETSSERREAPEEHEANRFAADVLLDGRANELVQRCKAASYGRIAWVKTAVQRIAAEEDVPVDVLANYLAYQLSLEGMNWWGAASNLQSTGQDPWRDARDVLFQRVEFHRLDEADLPFIVRALSEV